MFYWEYIVLSILLLPGIIFALYAQNKVQSTFSKFSKQIPSCNLTGTQVSKMLLDKNGIFDVQVMRAKGSLTDNYNPITKRINLSEPVWNSCSISAIGVAAHETGHALQDAKKYFPMKVRLAVIKLSNFTSSLFTPLILLGLILFFTLATPFVGEILIWVAVGIFSLGALINLITLPVELNASRRALSQLESLNIMTNQELSDAKKVLDAAALTYVASLAVSLLSLLRIVLIALSMTSSRKD